MKKVYTYLFVLLLTISGGELAAQTVVIPDPNFRQFLLDNYPSVMDPSTQQLIKNNAAAETGTFYCAEKNISDLEGIQYFTNITKLLCFKNNLSTLPDLSSMTHLIELSCFENQITSLPFTAALTNLETLNAYDNKLTAFPPVTGLTNLIHLQIFRNNLTTIPDLSGLVSLQNFICFENQITSMGKMPASLKELGIGDNYLTSLPDISLCTGLTILAAYTNRLTSVPELFSYTSLVHLNLGTNEIESVPGSLSSMTGLTYLTLDNNLFQNIPDLSGLTQLTHCNLQNNFLTFEDLLPSSANPTFASWIISPQDSLDISRTYSGTENKNISFTLNEDENISGLTFSWYHNGSLRAQTSVPVLEIFPLKKEDAGTYYCLVSSSDPLFSTLTLVSKKFTLGIRPDLSFEKELTLTPDGDGVNDEYLFEENGQLKVYNSSGNLLDQQSTPSIWNGSIKSGKVLGTGFYIIRINDNKTYGVTIIR